MNDKEEITILGAGLVGSLLSIFLAKEGYSASVLEKRNDPRIHLSESGRSINLALSHRGLKSLDICGLKNTAIDISIPMYGRMIHDEKGQESFQPYDPNQRCIYSISRNELNKILIDSAEENRVNIEFNKTLHSINLQDKKIQLSSLAEKQYLKNYSILVGTDGAFSEVRKSLEKENLVQSKIETLDYGYKELVLPAINKTHAFNKNALHIWPRHQYMLIALPNLDGSFTCTLFLPLKGKNSFEAMSNDFELKSFFENNFPDILPLFPDINNEYFSHPLSHLSTVYSEPWRAKDIFLMGDAAHAIVPFYGQGMNAGFEGVRIFIELLKSNKYDWFKSFEAYQNARKVDTDAIAKLALDNFIEMRDSVADKKFILKKKIEAKLQMAFPDKFLPLYTMVTFSDLRYSEALKRMVENEEILNHILSIKDIEQRLDSEEGWKEVSKILLSIL